MIAMIVISVVVDQKVQTLTSQKIEAEMKTETNRLSLDINGWMLGKAQIVESLSALMKQGVGAEVTPEYLNQVLFTAGNEGSVSDVYVGTTEGEMIDGSLWVPGADYDPRTRPWYQAAEQSDDVVFTDAYQDMVTGKWAISVAHSIRNDKEDLQGVLAMDILLDTITDKIAIQQFGKTGYAMLLDAKGVIIAHKDSTLLNTNLSDIKGLEDVAAKIATQDEGFVEYEYDGVSKIMFFSKMPSTSWVVAVMIYQMHLCK